VSQDVFFFKVGSRHLPLFGAQCFDDPPSLMFEMTEHVSTYMFS